MHPLPHWEQLDRKNVYESQFINLYQDTVKLPTGTIIDDYTVASLPDGVIVVATNSRGQLLTQFEYKYAIDQVILNLPSGSLLPGEDPLYVAKKELLEETGYTSDSFELIQQTYEYPSKLTHIIYIVRATNVYKTDEVSREETETISDIHFITADMEDFGGTFNTTYNIAALALTLPEFLKKS